jgi:hypothetical protein
MLTTRPPLCRVTGCASVLAYSRHLAHPLLVLPIPDVDLTIPPLHSSELCISHCLNSSLGTPASCSPHPRSLTTPSPPVHSQWLCILAEPFPVFPIPNVANTVTPCDNHVPVIGCLSDLCQPVNRQSRFMFPPLWVLTTPSPPGTVTGWVSDIVSIRHLAGPLPVPGSRVLTVL